MITEYDIAKWLRKLELVSLIQSIAGPPTLLFIMATQFFILVPPQYVSYKYGLSLILGSIFLLFIFAKIFGTPFRHYVNLITSMETLIGSMYFVSIIFNKILE